MRPQTGQLSKENERAQNKRIVYVTVVVTGIVSFAVLVGWFFQIENLKSVLPGFITMKANTAICFALLALALWFARSKSSGRKNRNVITFLSVLVGLISVLTLYEYLTGQLLGIDELFFIDSAGVRGRFPPGRLAPITAVNFLLLSASFICGNLFERPRVRISQGLALISFLAAFQVLIGYLVGTMNLFGTAFYTLMALHTAFCFVCLSLAIFASRPDDGFVKAFTSPLQSSVMSRKLLGATIVVPVLVHFCAKYGLDAGYYNSDFSILIQVMGSITLIGILIIAIAQALYSSEIHRENARERAELANLAKANFLANISHEIRTPLGAVLGFSDLLVADSSESERMNLNSAIRRNGDQLLRLIDDLLEISKIESNDVQLVKTRFDLKTFLQQILIFSRLKASHTQVEFIMFCQAALPEFIETDEARLRQILLNLVGNAVKFNRTGGTVKLTVTYQSLPQNRLSFAILDNGIGLTEATEQALYQPFTQGDASSTRKFGGSGVGLSISKHIVQALGGDLRFVRPESGVGSLFSFDIDPGPLGLMNLKEIDVTSLGTEIKTPIPDGATKDKKSPLRDRQILLVEDSVDNQVLVSRYLKAAGATVEIASDGLEGVNKALHGKFDLVLMDLQMPNLDGIEALRRLRGIGYNVPIVALTAHALVADRDRSLMLGFAEHITKPVDKTVLVHTVERFCSPALVV